MEHPSNDPPNQHKNNCKLCNEMGIPWDNMIRISQWKESHCRTNTTIKRKKYIQKSRTVTVTVREASRQVNQLSKVICDKKNYNIARQIYQFHQNSLYHEH